MFLSAASPGPKFLASFKRRTTVRHNPGFQVSLKRNLRVEKMLALTIFFLGKNFSGENALPVWHGVWAFILLPLDTA